jgi:hypothetical protein
MGSSDNRPSPPEVAPPRQLHVLSGWKDIATYLRKSVRSVQRYERDSGLPVRHLSSTSVGSVIATKAELDGWAAAAPVREIFRLSQKSTRRVVSDTKVALQELHSHMTEFRRLRAESKKLRLTLRQAMDLLQKSVLVCVAKQASSEFRVPTGALNFPSKKIQ